MKIERFEITPGFGTAIRFGGVVAWADPAASPALVSFLAQSVRNLGPSTRGGRQIADHIAAVLVNRDPEPAVGFAVIGPSDHGWATLLHGPVQVWDGSRWLYPPTSPGWIQAILTPKPAITVSSKGAATPAVEPSSLLDLEAGVVPGGGFVLLPGAPTRESNSPAPTVPGSELIPPAPKPVRDIPTAVIPAGPPTAVLEAMPTDDEPPADLEPQVEAAPAAGQDADRAEVDRGDGDRGDGDRGDGDRGDGDRETEPTTSPQPVPEPVAAMGPAGSIDLRIVSGSARPPLPAPGGPSPTVAGAPVVAGVACPRGHFNRSGLTACARCGTEIAPGTDAISGTRPALGALVVDDGMIFRVDRPYLVGAEPEKDPSVSGGLARPLPLTGDGVSGTHAELRLHDWDVLILDRASASGTAVFEPGASGWVRLNPYEPRMVPPGTHVAFGPRIITFIGPWARPAP